MKTSVFSIKKHTGKVNLAAKPALGNGTVKVAATPFKASDTTYYQVGPHGDYVQEAGG